MLLTKSKLAHCFPPGGTVGNDSPHYEAFVFRLLNFHTKSYLNWTFVLKHRTMRHQVLTKFCSKRWRPFSLPKRFLSTATLETEVLIVGGGVVGCALAQQLTTQAPSLKVGLVEARSAPSTLDDDNDDSENQAPSNPRSYALSPFSLQLLGLDSPEASSRLGFYDSMQIWEAGQPASLLFHAEDIQAKHLGAVVEDSTIVRHLWKQLQNSCDVLENSMVRKIDLPTNTYDKANISIVTKSGETETERIISTNLVVGADGANSAVRRLMGIARTQFEYGQSALTFTVKLDGSHGGRAFQRFLATGPLALLPTFSPSHAIVVWSTTAEEASRWKNHPELIQHVNQLLHDGPMRLDPFFGTLLGGMDIPTPLSNILYGVDKIIETAQYGPAVAAQEMGGRPFLPTPTIIQTASPQFTFPLQTGQVHNYTAPRLALIGDAAHTVRTFEFWCML